MCAARVCESVQIFGLEVAAAGSGVVKLSYRASGLSVRYGSPGIGGGGGGDDGGALRSHPVGYTLLILNVYIVPRCAAAPSEEFHGFPVLAARVYIIIIIIRCIYTHIILYNGGGG